MPDIFLYSGAANPPDIILSDPTISRGRVIFQALSGALASFAATVAKQTSKNVAASISMLRALFQAVFSGGTFTPTSNQILMAASTIRMMGAGLTNISAGSVVSETYMLRNSWIGRARIPWTQPTDIDSLWEDWNALVASGTLPKGITIVP